MIPHFEFQIMKPFQLTSNFTPAGDQPDAINALTDGLKSGKTHQTLLGVTGSGKTYSIANVIERIQRPAIVVTHNKTLAAQLYSEFKNFFKNNAVEYFISYYDYYLPEAYIPQTDTYIAKDSSINDDIEKLRLAATSSLMERRDVIIVASVSCIYGLGSPEDFARMSLYSKVGDDLNHEEFFSALVKLMYDRNDISCQRGTFRVSGDTVDVFLAYRDDFIRFEFWGNTIERISCRDPLTARVKYSLDSIRIFPAKHFMLPEDRFSAAKRDIIAEMKEQVKYFEEQDKYVEAQRIFQRTTYDLEMMGELGYCSGIENYSRHLSNREPGSRPYTLLNYFPDDFVTIIDESHVTIPQLQAMYNADRSRKLTLVEHGFRLPSALDNRPLNFEEFNDVTGQIVFVTATPGKHEISCSIPIEQVVRPTGLLDPEVLIRPLENQVDDLINEIRDAAAKNERVLVTTLTKRMSEDLADYLKDIDIRVKYIHSEIDALERVEILRDLRQGKIDCLVGINLLREGLDLPEVSLVAILDADKEGFLRSETSLIQTAGRASRNANGRVILYADQKTKSITRMMEITTRRRSRQQRYNKRNNIVPKTVKRAIQESLYSSDRNVEESSLMIFETRDELDETILSLEKEMLEAAESLEFERAALLRDQIATLKQEEEALKNPSRTRKKKKIRY